MRKTLTLILSILMILSLYGYATSKEALPLSEERIIENTEYLCNVIGIRVTGTEKEKETCDWLEGQLEQIGFSYDNETLKRSTFEGYPGMFSENLMAVCNPDDESPIWCVVSHYDSVGTSPGARDNACSVAILLEIAKDIALWQDEFESEIRLVFLGSEENGYHGSRAYMESLSEDELKRHRGVINMDISAATLGEGQLVCCTLGGDTADGYQNGNFLEPMDNVISRTIGQACKELYGMDVPVLHRGESDQVSFHQWQLDCANVCWRRIEDGMPILPPEYHGQDDIPQTIDYDTALITGRCVLWTLKSLACE